jgi:hypothetical protein
MKEKHVTNAGELPMNAAEHIKDLCETYRVKKADLLGPSKRRIWVNIRQELYFRLVVLRGLSMPQAGRRIGKRDHTTVLYGLRKLWSALTGMPLRTPLAEIKRIFWTQINPVLQAVASLAQAAAQPRGAVA